MWVLQRVSPGAQGAMLVHAGASGTESCGALFQHRSKMSPRVPCLGWGFCPVTGSRSPRTSQWIQPLMSS